MSVKSIDQNLLQMPPTLCEQIAVTVEKVYWLVVGLLNPVIDFFTQGLADFLCLETLRHGTSWSKYLNIRVQGSDPSLGGISASKKLAEAESTQGYLTNARSFFFVFRDNVGKDFQGNTVDVFKRFDVEERVGFGMGVSQKEPLSCGQRIKQELFIRFAPRFYAWSAGCAECSSDSQDSLSKAKSVAWGCLNITAPTVKFRFRPEELQKTFQEDPLMIGSAMRTNLRIGTEHLGFKGILLQGCDKNLGSRMANNPKKCLWGLARLINPIGICLLLATGVYLAYQKVSETFYAESF